MIRSSGLEACITAPQPVSSSPGALVAISPKADTLCHCEFFPLTHTRHRQRNRLRECFRQPTCYLSEGRGEGQAGASRSLAHLIGKREQLRWHVEAERLGRLEVDDELEFRRLHHRQVGR